MPRNLHKKVKTTNSKHHLPRYPNLVKDMVVSRLNQLWLADITYIRIRSGFVYLAAILDAYSRRVIGYAISTSLETGFVIDALRMAIAARQDDSGPVRGDGLRVGASITLVGLRPLSVNSLVARAPRFRKIRAF